MLTKVRAETTEDSRTAQFPLRFRNCPEIRGEESLWRILLLQSLLY